VALISAKPALLTGALILAMQLPLAAASSGYNLDVCGKVEKLALTHDPMLVDLTLARPGAWVEVDSNGQDLDVTTERAVPLGSVPIPPRLGLYWLDASSPRRLTMARARGQGGRDQALVTLHCPDAAGTARRRSWLERFGPIASKATLPIASDALDPLLAEIERFARGTGSLHDQALAWHVRAQALLAGGRYDAATEAFAKVEVLWQQIGDRARAAAARAAQVDLLNERSLYVEALSLAQKAHVPVSERAYYDVRVSSAGCTSLTFLGRWEEAVRCHAAAANDFRRLGEHLELANVLRNAAMLELDLGHARKGEALAHEALPLAIGTYGPMLRGRIELVLCDLALLRGDIDGALQAADAARLAFEGVPREVAQPVAWEIAALLRSATIYREIGAFDEAYRAITRALRLVRQRSGTSDTAKSLLALARVARADGNLSHALTWAQAAERIFSRIGAKRYREEALLASARIQLDLGQVAEVDREWSSLVNASPLNQPALHLLDIERRIRHGDLAVARAGLDQLKGQTLGLSPMIERSRLEAMYWRARGDGPRALAAVGDGMQAIGRVAAASGSGVLRHLVARQADKLQAIALAGVADASPSSDSSNTHRVSDAWRWLSLRSQLGAGRGSATVGSDGATFDSAVARELLLGAASSTAPRAVQSQQALMSLLASTDAGSASPVSDAPAFTIASLQSALGERAMFMAWLQSEDHGAVLLVTRDSAQVLDAATPATVREHGARLRKLLLDAGSSPVDIDASAKSVSADLWRNVPSGVPPKRLLVLAGSPLDTLPWPMLAWPGAGEPLVETTSVSLVRLAHAAPDHARAPVQRLAVVVADQVGTAPGALGELAWADEEPSAIREALVTPLAIAAPPHATRSDVLELLGSPDTWLHVAAHGTAQPSRLGYAGIWLDPKAQGELPQFLSWLDVLQQGVRSPLVVLDACQLGESGDAAKGSIGFASAVSQAGAEQVVAALWPVSDTASGIWVPAFYSALSADPIHDAAAALTAAQRALRHSRMFRHPFHWAGWQAFGSLALGRGSDKKVVAAATPAPPPATTRR
jgi:CHAT domain-containing protein/tetratricopeptide (TPR) repeat protein